MSNKFPRQTVYPLTLGSLCSAVGIQVLCWAIGAGQVNVVYGMMALAGFGVGVRMSSSAMHGLALFPPSRTAQVTCVFAFALPLGGAVGLTIMSTVYNNKLGAGGGGDEADRNYQEAIMYAYYAIVPFMWSCVVACLFLGNVWVKRGDGGDGHEVVRGAYLVSLITRKKLVRETKHRGDEDGFNLGADAGLGRSSARRKEGGVAAETV